MLQSGAIFSQKKSSRRIVSQIKGIYMGARVGNRGRFDLPPLPLLSQLQSTDPSTSSQHFIIMNNVQEVKTRTIEILNSVSYLQKQDLGNGGTDLDLNNKLEELDTYVLTVNLDLPDVKRDNMPKSISDLVSEVVVDLQPGSRVAVKEVLKLWLMRNVCFIADLLFHELQCNPKGLDLKADWISQCFTAIKHLRGTLKDEMATWCGEMWTIRTSYPERGMDRDEALRIFRDHTWKELTGRGANRVCWVQLLRWRAKHLLLWNVQLRHHESVVGPHERVVGPHQRVCRTVRGTTEETYRWTI
jgi:hypothetical protein